MTDVIDTYCGLSCSDCAYKSTYDCNGCIASNGNPFHGKCEIAECAKAKGKGFCGECEQFACEALTRYAYDAEHGDNGARIERCRAIMTALVKQARVGVNPVSYCGHHCDYCFLAQKCGGCRSEYNCCSFAALFGDRNCPNVTCAKKKGVYGCYQCDDLADCQNGYYARDDEYIAKATALFIKRHGEESYTKTLKRAIDAGEKYPESFDQSKSVENALAILETYL